MILKFDFFHENVPFSKFIHFIHQAIKLEGALLIKFAEILWQERGQVGDFDTAGINSIFKVTMKVIFHIIL